MGGNILSVYHLSIAVVVEFVKEPLLRQKVLPVLLHCFLDAPQLGVHPLDLDPRADAWLPSGIATSRVRNALVCLDPEPSPVPFAVKGMHVQD